MKAIRATSALLFLFCLLDLAQAQPGFEVETSQHTDRARSSYLQALDHCRVGHLPRTEPTRSGARKKMLENMNS